MTGFKGLASAAAVWSALALAGAPSQAATISLTGGTAGSIPDGGQTNDVLLGMGLGPSIAGFFGAQLNLSGTSRILVELLGYEAGYSNRFTFAGGSFYTETADPTPGNNREVFVTPPAYRSGPLSGLLSFIFSTSGGGHPASVANGSNPNGAASGPTGVNFFASVVGAPNAQSGRSVMLFFDDNGGGNDDDYDDLVIRVSAVPVPATLPLLAGAIAAFGFLARRRRRGAA